MPGRSSAFQATGVPDLPRSAWLLEFDSERGARLYAGPFVELRDGWFAEGAWKGPFTRDGFARSDFRCGTGGYWDGNGFVIFPPSHSTEAIYSLRAANGSWCVSNSVHCIVGAVPAACPPVAEFGQARKRAKSIKLGREEYERVVYRVAGGTMFRIGFRPFRIGPSHIEPEELQTEDAQASFNTYEAYVDLLKTTAGDVATNAASPERQHRYTKMVAGMSGGYDSPACAVIAAAVGAKEAVSLTTGRGGIDEPGNAIAKRIGLISHSYPRVATAMETRTSAGARVTPESVVRSEIDWILLSSMVTSEDVINRPFAEHIEGAIFVTGYFGDKIWGMNPQPGPSIVRLDNSGGGMDEFRKHLGFVHLPLPFAYAHLADRVAAISRSPAMAAYSLDQEYNRPIPRRILEEAGIPRGTFANKKAMASALVDWPLGQQYAVFQQRAAVYWRSLANVRGQ